MVHSHGVIHGYISLFCDHRLYFLTSASGLNSGPLGESGAEAGLGLVPGK